MSRLGVTLLIALLVVAATVAWAPGQPSIEASRAMPRILGDLLSSDLLAGAPLVVIGTIGSVHDMGGDTTLVDKAFGAVTVYKQAINIDVEHVLKGMLPRGGLFITYYAGNFLSSQHKSLRHALVTGQRRIFFLRETPGGIRSFQDVFASDIHICSGQHAAVPARAYAKDSIATTIAYLLLTPAADVDESRFVRCLSETAISDSIFLVGRAATIDLLSALVNHESAVIRFNARLLLAKRFDGQSHYLSELLETNQLSGDQTRMATQVLQECRNYERHVEFELNRDAVEWITSVARSYRGGDIEGNICDQLKVLVMHQRPMISEVTCSVARAHFRECLPLRTCN